MSTYENDLLMAIMSKQIQGDDYNNNHILWQYERLDDIIKCIHNKNNIIGLDTKIQRDALGGYLQYMYKPFDDYLTNECPDLFKMLRNGRYLTDLEYYALHEYLKTEGFTIENVNKFIELNKNNKEMFLSYKKKAVTIYFNKYGKGMLNESDYDSTKFERYRYA